jgi:uncharacterized protein (TIGR02246 family)
MRRLFVRAVPALLLAVSISGCSTTRTTIEPATVHSGLAAEAVVQRQIDAYNRRDLESFLSLFAPDAKLYQFPDKLLLEGHEALRGAYGKLFAEAVNLRAVVTDRTVQGRFVVDREITSGMPGKEAVTGVAIYEVIDGKVARVWFVD